MAPEDMTSKEYYLDSTAHFAVHEVRRQKQIISYLDFRLGIIKR
jgi:hypothetical protein